MAIFVLSHGDRVGVARKCLSREGYLYAGTEMVFSGGDFLATSAWGGVEMLLLQKSEYREQK
jgi:hypothetical protein